jgi:uncharacterized protein (TIGR00645 family)
LKIFSCNIARTTMNSKLMDQIEDALENKIIFGSRWLLAPVYVILVCTLAVLCYETIEEFVQLIFTLHKYEEARAIAQILVIVDLVLVMNLILMVLFVGYVNFVSVIHPKKIEDWPKWLGTLDYSGLKIQLLGSIIAISAINLLRVFVDLSDQRIPFDLTRILLMIGILLTFLVSALIMAIVNKLKAGIEHQISTSQDD